MLALALCLQAPDLDAILNDPALQGAATSVYVSTLDGKPLFARNEAMRLVPASNEKIFTGTYALHTLGPDHRGMTFIWPMDDATVVESTGDPGLTYDRLLQAKADLKLDGKKAVYIAQRYRPGIPPSWEYDDLPNKYAAAITAFTVDRGSFEVWGSGENVFFQPSSYGNRVSREGKTGETRVEFDLFHGQAKVFGVPPKTRSRLDTLAIPEPDLAAGSLLGWPVYRTRSVPASAAPYRIEGRSVADLLKDCLVHSDNMLAESLLMMAAAKEADLSESAYSTAGKLVKRFLTGVVGVNPTDVRPYDGSGLSRHNQLTTRAIAKVLAWERTQPTAALWMDCLAAPGAGTLKDRLEKTTFHGKTGTMDGVVALSGYLSTADGKELILSFVVNQSLGGARAVREVQDRFVRAMEGARSTDLTGSKTAASERSRG